MSEILKPSRKEIPLEDGRRMVATYDSSGELRKTWIEGFISIAESTNLKQGDRRSLK